MELIDMGFSFVIKLIDIRLCDHKALGINLQIFSPIYNSDIIV